MPNDKIMAKVNSPRFQITKDHQKKIDELAASFDWGTGDIMAVSYSIRNLLVARFEYVLKHGKDSGE